MTPDDLVLLRQPRGGSDLRARDGSEPSIAVFWKGVPTDLLHAAPFEWKLQRVSDDAESVPIALSLDSAVDPADIKAVWWFYDMKKQKFLRCENIAIIKEAFAAAASSHLRDALVTWAKRRGSKNSRSAMETLKELDEVVKQRASDSAQAISQLCQDACKDCAPSSSDDASMCSECKEPPPEFAKNSIQEASLREKVIKATSTVQNVQIERNRADEVSEGGRHMTHETCEGQAVDVESGRQNAAIPSPSRAPSRAQAGGNPRGPSTMPKEVRSRSRSPKQKPQSEPAGGKASNDVSRLQDRNAEVAGYLRECPEADATAIIRSLLATRPGFRLLLSKEVDGSDAHRK
jgi:hypothetical protein